MCNKENILQQDDPTKMGKKSNLGKNVLCISHVKVCCAQILYK